MAKTLNQAIIDGTVTVCGALLSQADIAKLGFAGGLQLSPPDGVGAMTVVGGTVTMNSPLFSGSQEWDNATEVFKGIYLGVNPTAYDPLSYVVEIEVNGFRAFSIDANGRARGRPFRSMTAHGRSTTAWPTLSTSGPMEPFSTVLFRRISA